MKDTVPIPHKAIDPWEPRLTHQWRRLHGLRGTGSLTKKELDQAGRELLVLQRGLTGSRRLIGDFYLNQYESLAAYLIFYWSVSRAQVQGMLDLAFPSGFTFNQGLFQNNKHFRILDLGAGPGPCGIAAAEWLQTRCAGGGRNREIHISACDASKNAIECGTALATETGFRYTGITPWKAEQDPIPTGSFDLIILGHLLNELYTQEPDRPRRRFRFLLNAASQLSEGGALLVLEPALLSTGRELLALRDLMTAEGWSVRAPCFRDGPCPALSQEGHTCHSDFPWEPPSQMLELMKRTGLKKDLVKTTAFVFIRSPNYPSGEMKKGLLGSYRVVSDPLLNKAGRKRILLCGQEGRISLSAKAGEGFPSEGVFLSLKRSDAIQISGAVPRETGYGLGPDTVIDKITKFV